MAIGSVIKNTLVYVVVMGISIFIAVNFFLFEGLYKTLKYADTNDYDTGTEGIFALFAGLLIIFVGLGVAINVSLPSIVSDELVEF